MEKFLVENKEELIALRDSRKANSPMSRLTSGQFPEPSAEDIARWVDPEIEGYFSFN